MKTSKKNTDKLSEMTSDSSAKNVTAEATQNPSENTARGLTILSKMNGISTDLLIEAGLEETSSTEPVANTAAASEPGRESVPDQGRESVPDQGRESVPEQGHESVPEQGHESVPDQGRESVPAKRRNNIFKAFQQRKWSALAAGLAFCVLLGALAGVLIPRLTAKPTSTVMIGEISRIYRKDASITVDNSAIVWPWKYLEPVEQYTNLTCFVDQYFSLGCPIDEDKLDNLIVPSGLIPQLSGYDVYTDQTYTVPIVGVAPIRGVPSHNILAAPIEGQYYIFMKDGYYPPATLGEMLEDYNLSQTLVLDSFTVSRPGNVNAEFDPSLGTAAKPSKDRIPGAEANAKMVSSLTADYQLTDTDAFWKILSECTAAPFVGTDLWDTSFRVCLQFCISSEELGVSHHVLNITADGYLQTNLFQYNYVFDIGENAAAALFKLASEHAAETTAKPFLSYVGGKITGITEEYVLVDDSILCADPSQGMTFRIPLDSLRIRRCIEFAGIQVDDIVSIPFTGTADPDGTIHGACTINRGYLQDGGMYVLE